MSNPRGQKERASGVIGPICTRLNTQFVETGRSSGAFYPRVTSACERADNEGRPAVGVDPETADAPTRGGRSQDRSSDGTSSGRHGGRSLVASARHTLHILCIRRTRGTHKSWVHPSDTVLDDGNAPHDVRRSLQGRPARRFPAPRGSALAHHHSASLPYRKLRITTRLAVPRTIANHGRRVAVSTIPVTTRVHT